jgi:hypothetical protein
MIRLGENIRRKRFRRMLYLYIERVVVLGLLMGLGCASYVVLRGLISLMGTE